MDRANELLQQLGLNGSEARAYLGLLGCAPASAYEVARQSGIPTSKIYQVINRLVDRGYAVSMDEADSKARRYMAISPADFLARVERQTHAVTRELAPLLETMGNQQQQDLVMPLGGADVLATAHTALDSAEQTVLVSLWPEELRHLESLLQHKAEAGIKVAIVHFGKSAVQIGATYHHPAEQTLYEEKGGRGLTLVVDSQLVVIGHFDDRSEPTGAWSSNPAFVTVAEDYVKHDVYITKVTRFLAPEMKARFGADYARLRDVFDADA